VLYYASATRCLFSTPKNYQLSEILIFQDFPEPKTLIFRIFQVETHFPTLSMSCKIEEKFPRLSRTLQEAKKICLFIQIKHSCYILWIKTT